jgi:hypothetical protein
MKLTVNLSYLGQDFALTLESTAPAVEINRTDVAARITNVLNRELQRFAEITTVALKDLAAADVAEAEVRARKARGEVLPKAPAQVLAAGTKSPEGRVVLEVKE